MNKTDRGERNMDDIVDRVLTVIFVLIFVTIVPATYAVANNGLRPDTIKIALDMPPIKHGTTIVYDVINPEPGKLLDPPEGFPIYYEWKSSGIADFTTYIERKNSNPEGTDFHAEWPDDNIHANERSYTREEHICMAKNIYFEARSESIKGQLAVALVTLQRVQDPRYPSNVCDVIYDNKQFSWYWDGLSDHPRNPSKYREIALFTSAILDADVAIYDFTYDATHYHADYVQPYWAPYMVRKAKIETHIFYREESTGTTSL